MADYKGIQGFSVEALASDPLVLNVWTVEGNIGTNRYQHRMAGTTSAALLFQGNTASPYDNLRTTETWDGTTWAASNNATFYTRAGIGWGTQSSAVLGSGYAGTGGGSGAVTTCNKFDGTSWSVTGSTVTTANDAGGVGADGGSGIMAGGWCPGLCTASEIFNGSSWATTNNTQSPGLAVDNGCAGIKSSAMLWGSDSVPNGAGNTQTWNDTCWATSPAAMVGFTGGETAIQNASGAGASNTSAISTGGQTKPTGTNNFNTMQWDGTSWTAISASIANPGASFAMGCTGTKTAAMITGGRTPVPGSLNQCQSFTGAPAPATTKVAVAGQMWYNTASNVIKTYGALGSGAYAAGGSLSAPRGWAPAVGTQTDGFVMGGQSPAAPGDVTICEKYNGTSFASSPALNTARSICATGGTSTAAIIFGGYPTLTSGEIWNNTAWSASPAILNTGSDYQSGAGTVSTACLKFGGATGSPAGTTQTAVTEVWDGTSWASTNNATLAKRSAAVSACGTSTSAFFFCGNKSPDSQSNNVQLWDGTSWANTNNSTRSTGAEGVAFAYSSSTKALAMGNGGPPESMTETYNGTSWATTTNTPRNATATTGMGTAAAAMLIGGNGPPATWNTSCIEWTEPYVIKTVTSS